MHVTSMEFESLHSSLGGKKSRCQLLQYISYFLQSLQSNRLDTYWVTFVIYVLKVIKLHLVIHTTSATNNQYNNYAI